MIVSVCFGGLARGCTLYLFISLEGEREREREIEKDGKIFLYLILHAYTDR